MPSRTEDVVLSQIKRILTEHQILDSQMAGGITISDDLFGPQYNLSARNLAYLVVLLERVFHQKVTPDDILQGRMSTVKGLAEAFAGCHG